jgi:heat shock protein HslJ
MRRVVPIVGVGACVAAVLVVTQAAAVTTGVRGTAASPLTDKVWVLVTLAGKPPIKGTEFTAEFTTTRRLSGAAGCNRYTGVYRASGTTIRVSPLATTQKACLEPIQQQERAFLRALSRARSFAVGRGTLTLKSAGGLRLATFRAQTQALAGTTWDVLAYNNGKQAVVSVLTATKVTATFGKDGNLTGFAGCNDYDATYQATAPRISIGPVAATRKHCEEPAGIGEQETAYLVALGSAATYRVEGSRLELRTADGALAVEAQRR